MPIALTWLGKIRSRFYTLWAVNGRGDTAAGQGNKVGQHAERGFQPAGNRLRHRVIGMAGQVGGPTQYDGLRHFSRLYFAGHQFRLAGRDRAGLVEGDDTQAAGFLQIGSALDQDAAPRRRGQAADDGDRCGDDQRGTGRR